MHCISVNTFMYIRPMGLPWSKYEHAKIVARNLDTGLKDTPGVQPAPGSIENFSLDGSWSELDEAVCEN